MLVTYYKLFLSRVLWKLHYNSLKLDWKVTLSGLGDHTLPVWSPCTMSWVYTGDFLLTKVMPEIIFRAV